MTSISITVLCCTSVICWFLSKVIDGLDAIENLLRDILDEDENNIEEEPVDEDEQQQESGE